MPRPKKIHMGRYTVKPAEVDRGTWVIQDAELNGHLVSYPEGEAYKGKLLGHIRRVNEKYLRFDTEEEAISWVCAQNPELYKKKGQEISARASIDLGGY